MPIRDYLAAMMSFQDGRIGTSAYRIRRAIGCSYKAALVFERKLREALIDSRPQHRLRGDVSIDATFLNGQVRRPNLMSDRATPEYKRYVAEHHARKLTLITIRQMRPERITRTAIAPSEGPEAAAYVAKNISPNLNQLASDFGSAWDNLQWRVKDRDRAVRVNHSERYDDEGVNTNANEGFHSFLKSGLQGVYKQSMLYVQDFMNEYAWRADHRFHSTGEQFVLLAEACAVHAPSRLWCGYWQGVKPAQLTTTTHLPEEAPTSSAFRRPKRPQTLRRVVASLRVKQRAGSVARDHPAGPASAS